MIHANSSDWLELKQCLSALEQTLVRLDNVGAGIAAIHVDAAIHQLNANLQAIEDANLADQDAKWVRIYSGQHLPH